MSASPFFEETGRLGEFLLPVQEFARETARQDFVNSFLVYSIFTTVSIIVLFLGRTKQNKSSMVSSKSIEKSI